MGNVWVLWGLKGTLWWYWPTWYSWCLFSRRTSEMLEVSICSPVTSLLFRRNYWIKIAPLQSVILCEVVVYLFNDCKLFLTVSISRCARHYDICGCFPHYIYQTRLVGTNWLKFHWALWWPAICFHEIMCSGCVNVDPVSLQLHQKAYESLIHSRLVLYVCSTGSFQRQTLLCPAVRLL